MAYNELVKNFECIRDYMREFYVYGFKSREEYNAKSARSYDDERRRIESWIGDYMSFGQTQKGKKVFISIDSRVSHHNPLYKAWKARSFTDGDITLHFIVFDILFSPKIQKSLAEITEEIDLNYLSHFKNPKLFDESTVRKKLKEYVAMGLIEEAKEGKTKLYSRAQEGFCECADALDFFSETAPCGVIGSFLLDKIDAHDENFAFKHHYITQALDSDILCDLFCAMHSKCEIEIQNLSKRSGTITRLRLVPLKIFISVQNGRQYLLAYQRNARCVRSFRLDYILNVKEGDAAEDFDALRKSLEAMQRHMWGVSAHGRRGKIEHVEFTICYGDNEEYIPHRMEREKRCGVVEYADNHHCTFKADVYDTNEMLPWIRTFICRITNISFSNKDAQAQFEHDIERMYQLYGLEGGEKSDI